MSVSSLLTKMASSVELSYGTQICRFDTYFLLKSSMISCMILSLSLRTSSLRGQVVKD